MKRIEILEKEELLKEHNGCVMYWINKDTDKCFTRSNAWEELATMSLNKYFHKVPWVKRVTNETNYNGTRTMVFYEEHGKRVFQYIK